MKKIVTILFVGLFTIALQAQEKTAKIEFKTETIDYGTIEKGADACVYSNLRIQEQHLW